MSGAVTSTGKRVRLPVETAEGPVEAELYTVDDDGGFGAAAAEAG